MKARPTGDEVGRVLSQALSPTDRAVFIRFVKDATTERWRQVVEAMEEELVIDGRDPATGASQ